MKKITAILIIFSIGMFTGGQWTKYLYKPVVNGCYAVVKANHELLEDNNQVIVRLKGELNDLESKFSRLNTALGIIADDKNR